MAVEHLFDQLYCQGYFAAVMDVKRLISGARYVLKFNHRKLTDKRLDRLIDFLIAQHIIIRDDPSCSISYVPAKDQWCLFNFETGKTIASEGDG
jgi:hypothetical protein